jgi:HAE1 family hydrophobic/amphiphilic exporter-1
LRFQNLKFVMNRHTFNSAIIGLAFALLLCVTGMQASVFAQQPGGTTTQPVTPAPSGNTPTQSAPPSSSSGVNVAPSGNNSQGVAPPPGSNARPVTPAGQTEQSVQPTTQADQQTRGTTPQPATQQQTPQGGAPTSSIPTTDSLPSGNLSAPASGQPSQQTPGQTVAPAQTPRTPGRESVPSPAPLTETLPSVPSIAPDYRAPDRPLPEIGRVGVDMTNQRPLSLREALEMALLNNKDMEVSRHNVRAAEFDLLGARGAYDPRFSSLSYYERTETPSASFLSGSASGSVKQSDYTGTARIEGLVPKYGGGYRVDFSAIRLTTDNQFAALNPQYPTALTFNYTQPLIRGFRFDNNRRLIEVAKRNLSLTDAQFRQRAIETITQVQRAYWDLVFTLRNLQIQRDAVRDARAQLAHNKRLVEEGVLAPIDVVAADAQVSGYEQSVYTALEDVQRAENNLKNLIAENRESPFWNVSIIPTDSVDLTPPTTTLDEAMDAAMANRTELQQSTVASEINQIDQRYFREQTKPQVDLVGSYGVVGLSGALNSSDAINPLTASTAQLRERINTLSLAQGLPILPAPTPQTIPSDLVGGLNQSLLNLGANRYSNFRVGVQLNLPLRNRTAEAQLGRSLVEGKRIATQREQLEQLVQVDVRNSLQTVRTAQSRLRAAAAAREASEQQYTSEQRRFDAGQSTLFLVLERQTALTTARGNELRAQTDLNKAIAELQRATGNAMQANNVVVSVK